MPLLDIAIWTTSALIAATAAYLGYSMWAHAQLAKASSPAARAVETLAQVAKERPRDPEARVRLAQALVSARRETEAIEQYRAAMKLEKDYPGALTGLGLLAMRRKEWRTAEGYWKRLIDALSTGEFSTHDQRLESAYYYMGVTLLERRDHEEALRYLKQAARMRDGASDTHYMLALGYKGLGLKGKYREELEIALTFDPNMAEANLDMGRLLRSEGDLATAAELFRRSADAAPSAPFPREELEKLGSAESHVREAMALRGKNAKKALDEARIAGALDTKDVETALLIAELYEKTGDSRQALTFYHRVLSMRPEDKTAQDAAARLEDADAGR